MNALIGKYEDGIYSVEVVKDYKEPASAKRTMGKLLTRARIAKPDALTPGNAARILNSLYALRENKEKILAAEYALADFHLKNKFTDRSIYIAKEKPLAIVHIDSRINNGQNFNIGFGLCANVDVLKLIPRIISHFWILQFNNFDDDIAWAFPIDGPTNYWNDQSNKTVWSNTRRWEYVEFLIKKLEMTLEILV